MPSSRKSKITSRALLDIRTPTEVAVAPDSRRVVYAVPEIDWGESLIRQHLFLRIAGEDAPPRQLTRGDFHESHAHWSPDGRWLAFIAARDDPSQDDDEDDDDELKEQLWILPMDGAGGEAYRLTNAPEGVGDYDWLPDSSGLVYIASEGRPKPLQTLFLDRRDAKDDAILDREERYRHQIRRVDVEGKKDRVVHPGDYGVGEVAVSPDGTLVAFTTNYTGEPNDYHKADVWTAPLDGGDPRRVTDGPGGKYRPHWTKTGDAILYFCHADPEISYSQSQLFSADIATGSIVNLTADFLYDLTGWPGIARDGEGRWYVTAAIGTATAIFRLTGGAFEEIVRNDEHIHDFAVAPSGAVAYIASALDDPAEVFWLEPGARDPELLTDLNDDWMQDHRPARSEVVAWPSSDGTEIEGILTYPAGYEPGRLFPLIVSLHGGPHGRVVQTLTMDSMEQVLAAEGYGVLSPNYRGSEGYGNDFGTASRGDLGGGDYEDVLTGVDWAIREAGADPERLGIMGSSYGGYLTNWAICRSDRFAAAISKFGIFSLVSDFSNTAFPRWEQEYLGAAYWDAPALYTERSPATYVSRITTPVLIMHGEQDTNTFLTNSQEMYNALRLQGKTAQFVRYPREDHGFSEPKHNIDEIERTVAWFDKYVRGKGQPPVHRVGDVITRDGWELRVTSAEIAGYAGRADDKSRFLEVVFVLRETAETRAPLTIAPDDIRLTRGASGRAVSPVGLPVGVLGQKVLAEGRGWRFAFAPGKEERGLAVPVAVAFKIGKTGGTYAVKVKEFSPVAFDIQSSGPDDEADE